MGIRGIVFAVTTLCGRLLPLCDPFVEARAELFEGLGVTPDRSRGADSYIDMDGAGETISITGEDASFVWQLGQPITSYAGSGPSSLGIRALTSTSHDGSTVLGIRDDGLVLLRDGALHAVPFPPGTGADDPLRFDLDDTGDAFVVGLREADRSAGFYWNGAEYVDLPIRSDLTGRDCDEGVGRRISADGNHIVGDIYCAPDSGVDPKTTVWDVGLDGAITARNLGPTFNDALPDTSVEARGVTIEGDIIVTSAAWPGAFLWSEADGMLELSLSPSLILAQTTDITPDGRTVVGGGIRPAGGGAVAAIWMGGEPGVTVAEIVALNPILSAQAEGWFLQSAQRVSDDGQVTVGVGVNPEGEREVWRLDMRPVPEPSTMLIAMLAAASPIVLRGRSV